LAARTSLVQAAFLFALLRALSIPDECEDVGIEHIGMDRHHAQRLALVDLQRRVLVDLCREQRGAAQGTI
jgi:hypothetical protein